MLCEFKTYENEKGIRIEHREVIDGSNKPANFIEFVGTIMVKVVLGNGQEHIEPVQFKIEATDLKSAFLNAEKAAEARLEEIKQQQKQQASKIQLANSLPPNMQNAVNGNVPPRKKLII